jgi:hypothetical protein
VGPCECGGESPGCGGAGHGQWPSGWPAEEETEEGKGNGEEDADVWAPVVGEKGERGRTWAGLATHERRERKRESGARAGKELGLGRGPRGRKERERESWAGPRGLGCFFPSSFPFLFYTQTFQTKLI